MTSLMSHTVAAAPSVGSASFDHNDPILTRNISPASLNRRAPERQPPAQGRGGGNAQRAVQGFPRHIPRSSCRPCNAQVLCYPLIFYQCTGQLHFDSCLHACLTTFICCTCGRVPAGPNFSCLSARQQRLSLQWISRYRLQACRVI